MGELATLLPVVGPQVGVFVLLAIVIIYLLRSDAAIRTQARLSIAAEQKRADDAERRADTAEERLALLQKRLDDEREQRRTIEDQHARDKREAANQHAELMREIRDLKSTVTRLEAELARLSQTAGGA